MFGTMSLATGLAADWDGHMGGDAHGWMWLWGTLMIVLFVAVIALVVWLVARDTHGHTSATMPPTPAPTDRARAILAERLARGEIDPDEYQERLRHLS